LSAGRAWLRLFLLLLALYTIVVALTAVVLALATVVVLVATTIVVLGVDSSGEAESGQQRHSRSRNRPEGMASGGGTDQGISRLVKRRYAAGRRGVYRSIVSRGCWIELDFVHRCLPHLKRAKGTAACLFSTQGAEYADGGPLADRRS
jgi:hypothetical protein